MVYESGVIESDGVVREEKKKKGKDPNRVKCIQPATGESCSPVQNEPLRWKAGRPEEVSGVILNREG